MVFLKLFLASCKLYWACKTPILARLIDELACQLLKWNTQTQTDSLTNVVVKLIFKG